MCIYHWDFTNLDEGKKTPPLQTLWVYQSTQLLLETGKSKSRKLHLFYLSYTPRCYGPINSGDTIRYLKKSNVFENRIGFWSLTELWFVSFLWYRHHKHAVQCTQVCKIDTRKEEFANEFLFSLLINKHHITDELNLKQGVVCDSAPKKKIVRWTLAWESSKSTVISKISGKCECLTSKFLPVHCINIVHWCEIKYFRCKLLF